MIHSMGNEGGSEHHGELMAVSSGEVVALIWLHLPTLVRVARGAHICFFAMAREFSVLPSLSTSSCSCRSMELVSCCRRSSDSLVDWRSVLTFSPCAPRPGIRG